MFQLTDTHGLPLAIIMARLQEMGAAVDIVQFIREARTAGWSDKKIRSTILEALGDVHGPEGAKQADRLDILLKG